MLNSEDSNIAIVFTKDQLSGLIQSIVKAELEKAQVFSPVYDPNERLTRKEVIKLYRITYPTLHKQMQQGLSYEKIGKKTLFKRSDVEHWFNSKRAQ